MGSRMHQTSLMLLTKLWFEDVDDWNAAYNTNITSVSFSALAFLSLLQAAPIDHTSSAIVA